MSGSRQMGYEIFVFCNIFNGTHIIYSDPLPSDTISFMPLSPLTTSQKITSSSPFMAEVLQWFRSTTKFISSELKTRYSSTTPLSNSRFKMPIWYATSLSIYFWFFGHEISFPFLSRETHPFSCINHWIYLVFKCSLINFELFGPSM